MLRGRLIIGEKRTKGGGSSEVGGTLGGLLLSKAYFQHGCHLIGKLEGCI